MKWKILLPIVLIAIIAVIIAIFFHLQRAMESASQYESDIFAPTFEKQAEGKDENKFPEPTGNIDDTVNAITNSLANEESLIEDEKEAEAIEADNQALNDFSESYDESEF